MDELNTKAAKLGNHVQEIAQTYYDLARINLAQGGAKAASRAIVFFVLTGFALCILMLVGIGLAMYLGALLKNMAAGYFIVAAFYLLLVLILYWLRKQVIFPFIRDFIVRKIYEKRD